MSGLTPIKKQARNVSSDLNFTDVLDKAVPPLESIKEEDRENTPAEKVKRPVR
jgi:hypothetical protein